MDMHDKAVNRQRMPVSLGSGEKDWKRSKGQVYAKPCRDDGGVLTDDACDVRSNRTVQAPDKLSSPLLRLADFACRHDNSALLYEPEDAQENRRQINCRSQMIYS
jgi:hypothetical protein